MIELKLATKSHICINLNGRIDSVNAEKVYEGIVSLRNEHPSGVLIFYCEKLNYISSGGLRVLLRLQKNEKEKIIMRRVKPEVAEILIITGFHKILMVERQFNNIQLPNGKVIDKISSEYAEEMANMSAEDLTMIEKQLREIDIDGCEIIGRGTTGRIYRLDNENIVKVYNKGIQFSIVLNEVMVSKKSFVHGLPTAISYDVVRVGDCYGAIFEMIGGETFADAIHREPEKYEYYATEYAALFMEIHNTPAEKNILPSAKQNFIDAAERCTKYYSVEEIDLIKKMIAAIPDRNTLVHRDYHPKNVMVSGGKLILIDMADVCIGHPIFDWMGIVATHKFFAEQFPKETEANTGMTPKDCDMLRNSLFDMYFKNKSSDEIETIKKQILCYAKILLGISPALRPEQPEDINTICARELRENLMPFVEEILSDISW